MNCRVLDRPCTITQHYGVINEVTGNPHKGVDIIPNGVSECYVWAHSKGVVTHIESNHNTTDTTGGSYGNYIVIEHPNGWTTKYAHLKPGSIVVSVGDIVNEGRHIATTGCTGRSTGIHLHWEIKNEKGSFINPEPYIGESFPNDNTIISNYKINDRVLVLSGRLTADSYGGGNVTAEYNGTVAPDDISNYLIIESIIDDGRPRPVLLRRIPERGGNIMGWASYEQITKNY